MPVKHKAERAGVEGESLRVIKKKKRRKEWGRVPQTILPLWESLGQFNGSTITKIDWRGVQTWTKMTTS